MSPLPPGAASLVPGHAAPAKKKDLSPQPGPEGVFFYDIDEGEPFEDEALLDEDREEEQWEDAEEELLPAAEPGALANFTHWVRGALGTQGDDYQDEIERRGAVPGAGGGNTSPRQPSPRGSLRSGGNAPRAGRSEGATANGLPEASGVFEKRSPGWVEGWQERSYLLRGQKLLYFRQDRPDRPVGVLDFGLVEFEVHCGWAPEAAYRPPGSVEEREARMALVEAKEALRQAERDAKRSCDCCQVDAPDSWATFFLRPKAFPRNVLAFRGPDDEIKELADNLIRLASARLTVGRPQSLPAPTTRNFWRYPTLSEADFLSQVDSGDILLFRGRDQQCQFTRVVTLARFDHVGLLLRSAKNEVFILEALGCRGVDALAWRTFRANDWHKVYSRLVYRKVYFQRSPEQLEALQDFVHSSLGKRYSLNLNKIFQRKVSREFDAVGHDVSALGKPGATEELETFFCSELVAACLKRCGVLAGARASSQYWPGTFSQRCPEPLPLQEEAFIGEEQQIVFNDMGY